MARSFSELFQFGARLTNVSKAGYHKSNYSINYDLLTGSNTSKLSDINSKLSPNPQIPSITTTPETVKRNLKNVQGWRGGAERGFLSVYPDLIHSLKSSGAHNNASLESWYTKVLTASLSSNFIGEDRYGLIVPVTYRQLLPTATNDQMDMAHRMGWAVEIVRAIHLLTDDSIRTKDEISSKFILRSKYNLGSKCINDIFLLQNSLQDIVHNYFKDNVSLHSQLLSTLMESVRLSAIGRTISDENHPVRSKEEVSVKLYKDLVLMNVTNTNYILPVRLGLYLAGLNNPKIHEQARKILIDIGYYEELKSDYYNCFMDPQGRFIEDGAVTWLLVIAHQRASHTQKKILQECYGKTTEKALEVKRVYRELKLQKTLKKHIEEKHTDILNSIQQISKLDKIGLSQEFWFKFLNNIKFN